MIPDGWHDYERYMPIDAWVVAHAAWRRVRIGDDMSESGLVHSLSEYDVRTAGWAVAPGGIELHFLGEQL